MLLLLLYVCQAASRLTHVCVCVCVGEQDASKMHMMQSQKTMEINPRHPVIAELNKRLQNHEDQQVRACPLCML